MYAWAFWHEQVLLVYGQPTSTRYWSFIHTTGSPNIITIEVICIIELIFIEKIQDLNSIDNPTTHITLIGGQFKPLTIHGVFCELPRSIDNKTHVNEMHTHGKFLVDINSIWFSHYKIKSNQKKKRKKKSSRKGTELVYLVKMHFQETCLASFLYWKEINK